MPENYLCKVIDKRRLAADTYSVTIICGDLADEARPGQFLHIKCGRALLLRRPISICSVRGDTLEFVFEVKGKGTRWLSGCRQGQMLDVLGPLGTKYNIPNGNIIVIGGGIGTPPILFAAESAPGEVTALLGFRNKSKIILLDEFKEVCDEIYIATDDGSFGIHGVVTAPLMELLEGGGFTAVLACGSRPMLSAVSVLCKLHNISCQVSLEERMGCGVGACLVCACSTVKLGFEQMSRVCKDGPVFDAEEIVW